MLPMVTSLDLLLPRILLAVLPTCLVAVLMLLLLLLLMLLLLLPLLMPTSLTKSKKVTNRFRKKKGEGEIYLDRVNVYLWEVRMLITRENSHRGFPIFYSMIFPFTPKILCF